MNINWYPGHMKKTLDNLQEAIKKVDLVLELVDARIPVSSRNPLLDEVIGDKARIILMNKADLADPAISQVWKAYLEDNKNKVMTINAHNGQGLGQLRPVAEGLLEEKFARDRERGMKDRTIKMMIVGIPNVGKSTLINTLAGRKGARVGNKPGLTRQNQWINTGNDMELLDTPGVLWHKFEDEEGLNLAFTGAIKDEILDKENLAYKLIERLDAMDPNILIDRYQLDLDEEACHYMDPTLHIMEEIGRSRGALIKGGLVDYDKVATIVLTEFRNGKLGRISLERPGDELEGDS